MASHEHLQQLNDEDDSSSSASGSSSSSSDSSSDSSDEPQDERNIESVVVDLGEQNEVPDPPKRRIKLSLRLPKKAPASVSQDADATESSVIPAVDSTDAAEETVDEEVVKATVVASDTEETEDVVQATVAEVAAPVAAAVQPATVSQPRPKAARSRRSPTPFLQAGRPVRLPPMSSAGLLIPPGVYRGGADPNGFSTPASVFDRAMSLAGYNTERRTQHPHRGSSVERVVGDMFDSNVQFSLHFPKLVPSELWSREALDAEGVNQESKSNAMVSSEKTPLLPSLLIKAISKPKMEQVGTRVHQESLHSNSGSGVSRKRKRSSFVDMVPISVSTPLPKAYIKKRLNYVKKVEIREQAIVASQEAALAAEDAMEKYEDALTAYNKRNQGAAEGNAMNGAPQMPDIPPKVEVPPIPVPPSPPRQSEMDGFSVDDPDEEHHPIYTPKGKEKFVSHLDQDCFHITNGRYYGLFTNEIADPNFVGHIAPGILGLNVSGGTGLATSYTGGGGGGAAGSTQAYFGRGAGSGNAGVTGGGSSRNSVDIGKAHKKGQAQTSGNAKAAVSSKVSKRSKDLGPAATSNSTDLKRFMEQDDAAAVEQMKVCIVRAAVYASRTGMHGRSFVGPDRETYPDVSKAFAAHAGLRPCNRCKNNKQGAYHCRLRRKHKDLDYDGGNSWGVLSSLFEEPIDDLLQK